MGHRGGRLGCNPVKNHSGSRQEVEMSGKVIGLRTVTILGYIARRHTTVRNSSRAVTAEKQELAI